MPQTQRSDSSSTHTSLSRVAIAFLFLGIIFLKYKMSLNTNLLKHTIKSIEVFCFRILSFLTRLVFVSQV